MALNRIFSQAALVLPLTAIVLALANWHARPDRAWAWMVAAAICVVMLVVRHLAQLASRRLPGDVTSARSLASVTSAVVWGALMVVIPLAVTLAHAYGVVADPASGQRATMVILGVYLATLGNAMPRALPPVSSLPGNGARAQAFQRRMAWTWTLYGVGFAAAWLVFPADAAGPVSMALTAAAMIVTVVQILRVRKWRQHTPGVS